MKLFSSLTIISLKFVIHANVVAGACQTPQGTLIVNDFTEMLLVFGPMCLHICKHCFRLLEKGEARVHGPLFHVDNGFLVVLSDPELYLLLGVHDLVVRLKGKSIFCPFV